MPGYKDYKDVEKISIVGRKNYRKFKKINPEFKELTLEEFSKDANLVLQEIGNYIINYPMGFKMGKDLGWLVVSKEKMNNRLVSEEVDGKIIKRKVPNLTNVYKPQVRWFTRLNSKVNFWNSKMWKFTPNKNLIKRALVSKVSYNKYDKTDFFKLRKLT